MTGVSETGMITSSGREGFSLGFIEKRSGGPTPTPSTQPILQNNMRLAYTSDATAAYNPLTSPSSSAGGQGGGGASPPPAAGGGIIMINMENNSGGVDGMKRKRGRPRKYGPDGSISLALLPNPPHSVSLIHPSSAEAASAIAVAPSPSLASGGSMVSPTSIKKARGRPPGSTNKVKKHQLQALGSAGIGFTPHVITVKTGEDVLSKVMSFSQHGPRAVCILSANGAISNVTLRQPATSGGTVTYEGRFEILSLSGSFLLSENGGQRSRTGGLSVSLSGPDGRVLGGGVAGLLTAATPVQVIVGSFVADGRKESKLAKQVDPLLVTTRVAPTVGMTGASSPPSRGTLSESSGGPASPLNMSTAGCNNGNPPQGIASMPWK